MRTVAVIPARMASTRLPGKPLAPLLGRPMIEHIFLRTSLCADVDEVLVATCDEEIRIAAEAFGARVVMTGDHHERASDRMAEVAEQLAADLYVLVQGDEPMIRPEMVSAAVEPFATDADVRCVNLMRRIEDVADLDDPNTIKVVVDQRSDALFMTRRSIPTLAPGGLADTPIFKQVCIIPFTADELNTYARLAPTPLERIESIDMLRLIEHGHRVRMVETPFDTHAVDTEADRVRVEAMLADDPLTEALT